MRKQNVVDITAQQTWFLGGRGPPICITIKKSALYKISKSSQIQTINFTERIPLFFLRFIA